MKPILLEDDLRFTRKCMRILVACAMGAVAMAVWEWFEPSQPPFRGRWSWVRLATVEWFGERSITGLWLAVALALWKLSRSLWRHTSRRPSDRWWRS